jgi:hypothetical protein
LEKLNEIVNQREENQPESDNERRNPSISPHQEQTCDTKQREAINNPRMQDHPISRVR